MSANTDPALHPTRLRLDVWVETEPTGSVYVVGRGLMLVSNPIPPGVMIRTEMLGVQIDVDEREDFIGIELERAFVHLGREIANHSANDPLAFLHLPNTVAQAIQRDRVRENGGTIMDAIRMSPVVVQPA